MRYIEFRLEPAIYSTFTGRLQKAAVYESGALIFTLLNGDIIPDRIFSLLDEGYKFYNRRQEDIVLDDTKSRFIIMNTVKRLLYCFYADRLVEKKDGKFIDAITNLIRPMLHNVPSSTVGYSGGIEPTFGADYIRTKISHQTLMEMHDRLDLDIPHECKIFEIDSMGAYDARKDIDKQKPKTDNEKS